MECELLHQERFLDDIESLHLGSAPTHVARYRGEIDHEALGKAFTILCRRHPVLRGRVRAEGTGHLLHVPRDHQPDLISRAGGEDVLLREVFHPWDPATSLARLVSAQDGGQGHLALRVDHSIADGHGHRAMFDELWHLYDHLAAGGVHIPEQRSRPLPIQPSRLLRRLWEVGRPVPAGPAGPWPSEESRTSPYQRVRPLQSYAGLTAAETRRFLEIARSNGSSVHSLVCGAILVAHSEYGTGLRQPVPMVCVSPVNLRNRVTPSVGTTETTNFVKIHRAGVVVGKDGDPFVVGRELKGRLDRSIARRDLASPAELPRLVAAPFPTPLEPRLATVQVSSNGIVHQRFHQLTDVSVTDVFTPIDVVPDLFPMYSVLTYQGRLSIRCVYPSNLFDAEDAREITRHISAQVEKILAGA